MNSNIGLLDCTLRDGGYVNDWKFGHSNLISITERLVDAGVEIVELGFIDERRPFDIDRSIFPDTNSAKKIYGKVDKKESLFVGMIDYGTCSLENIELCEESILDGIRVIFKKHLMYQAMEYCRELKNMGYKVFAQLVSITSYNKDELLELVSLVNDVKPYAVSMVDTYGLLHPEDLLWYYEILDENVVSEVNIGFHAHNNFQLAYANALSFIEKECKHNLVVDGTLFGMGKSAGNTPIELLAMRMNDKFGKDYNIDSMLESIEESVMDFHQRTPWGYKTFYYLCAKNYCHPNYLTYYQNKENLSTSKIDELLSMIGPEEKKLLYDKLVAEDLYNKYINENACDEEDKKKFVLDIASRPILVLGPGKNIELQKKKIDDYIAKNNPFVISINYIPEDRELDCIFVTKSNRYHEMTQWFIEHQNHKLKVLATTNVECRNGQFDYVVNRAPLLEKDEKFIDNSFLMLLSLFKNVGIKEVFCAGLDGYSTNEINYYKPSMEYDFIIREAEYLNKHMKHRIADFRKSMTISFITFSAYDVEEDIMGASI